MNDERPAVILPATETRTLHEKPTQAVDILAFVEAQEISSLYFESRYFLAPAPGDENGYAMLRETLRRTRQIGIAYVVIQARQHLAVVVPQGQSLILHTLRWTNEACMTEDCLSDDEELLAACWLAHRPHRSDPGGATRQDHRWRYRDTFHADVTMLNEPTSVENDIPYKHRVPDDGIVEIDDSMADYLHRRAHRVHAAGTRRLTGPRRHRQVASRPRLRPRQR